ncbi:hypothetical protein MUP59_03010 [Candidatus Bathyarchaeota archaeon]|nr:hypothetical protein [Candidatus Bathyarchaeota archaeon]
MFQVKEFLRHYLESEDQPEWLSNAIREFSWILQEHPLTAAFFNTAEEVLRIFILEQQTRLSLEDLKEVNLTALPRDLVVEVLRRAHIVEVQGEQLVPGKLTLILMNTKSAGYALSDPDFEKRMIEFRGVLTMGITWSLLQEERFTPRRVMAILAVFSMLILSETKPEMIDDLTFRSAMSGLTTRQQNRIRSYMAGFRDGRTKMIDTVNDDGALILKPTMVEYILRTRERLRERERDDRGR